MGHIMKQKPQNYRINPFFLFGNHFNVGGMARLDKNDDIDGAMQYLREDEGCQVIIGLHQSFAPAALRNGLEYYHIPVEDLPPPPAI